MVMTGGWFSISTWFMRVDPIKHPLKISIWSVWNFRATPPIKKWQRPHSNGTRKHCSDSMAIWGVYRYTPPFRHTAILERCGDRDGNGTQSRVNFQHDFAIGHDWNHLRRQRTCPRVTRGEMMKAEQHIFHEIWSRGPFGGKWGYPQIIHFSNFRYKSSNWGYPHFWNPPCIAPQQKRGEETARPYWSGHIVAWRWISGWTLSSKMVEVLGKPSSKGESFLLQCWGFWGAKRQDDYSTFQSLRTPIRVQKGASYFPSKWDLNTIDPPIWWLVHVLIPSPPKK